MTRDLKSWFLGGGSGTAVVGHRQRDSSSGTPILLAQPARRDILAI